MYRVGRLNLAVDALLRLPEDSVPTEAVGEAPVISSTQFLALVTTHVPDWLQILWEENILDAGLLEFHHQLQMGTLNNGFTIIDGLL